MSDPRFAVLPNRAVLRVAGEDAEHFLQNMVTCDIAALAKGAAAFGALLTPQGKILFEFLILRQDDTAYLIDTNGEKSAELLKRLGFYKLRAKVTIDDLSASLGVAVIWDGDMQPEIPGVSITADPRLAALGWRAYGPAEGLAALLAGSGLAEAAPRDWQAWRIAQGIPEGGADYAFGDAFPHDADMDQIGGVSFKKGCYVGQEVVSRMEHRSTARRRIIMVSSDDTLPDAGTPILAAGKTVGTLGSSTERAGLALVRLDKVKAALDNGSDLECGSARIAASLPGWARFGWPETVSED